MGQRLGVVAVAGAGVVDADPVAREAAEELRHRLAERTAEQVPQREIDRGVAADLDTARREAVEMAERLIRTPLFTSLKRCENEKVEFVSTSLKRGANKNSDGPDSIRPLLDTHLRVG